MSSGVAVSRDEPSRTPRLPWILLAVTVICVCAMVPLSLGQEELFDTVFFSLIALTFASLGALVAARHPANPIGWIFCAQGAWVALTELGEALPYHALPGGELGAWVIGWSWVVDMSIYAVVFLLFPSGRLLTPRWRLVLWTIAAALVLGVPGGAMSPDNADNPFPVESVVLEAMFALGMLLLLASLAAAVVSVVIRFRRATGIERLQLKQLVFAGGAFLPTAMLAVPFYNESVAVRVAISAALLGIPVAAGLAILRYRLYDIDVVINRTLVYGALTAALAGAYLGSVLVLQLVFSAFTEGSGLAVAASTLAVAGLFRPLRRRIQATVDRRFFRRRYDAARTLAHFGARVRDEVDLDALGGELRAVVAETMQPAHVTLWLRRTKVTS